MFSPKDYESTNRKGPWTREKESFATKKKKLLLLLSIFFLFFLKSEIFVCVCVCVSSCFIFLYFSLIFCSLSFFFLLFFFWFCLINERKSARPLILNETRKTRKKMAATSGNTSFLAVKRKEARAASIIIHLNRLRSNRRCVRSEMQLRVHIHPIINRSKNKWNLSTLRIWSFRFENSFRLPSAEW